MDRASGESYTKATPRGAAPRRARHRGGSGSPRGRERTAAPCGPGFVAVPQNETLGKKTRRPGEALFRPPRMGHPARPWGGSLGILGEAPTTGYHTHPHSGWTPSRICPSGPSWFPPPQRDSEKLVGGQSDDQDLRRPAFRPKTPSRTIPRAGAGPCLWMGTWESAEAPPTTGLR